MKTILIISFFILTLSVCVEARFSYYPIHIYHSGHHSIGEIKPPNESEIKLMKAWV